MKFACNEGFSDTVDTESILAEGVCDSDEVKHIHRAITIDIGPRIAGFLYSIRFLCYFVFSIQKHLRQLPNLVYSQRHHHSYPVPLPQTHLRR